VGDAERMRELLRYANYAKVAAAIGVTRAAVAEWAKGRDVSPYRLHQVEELLTPGQHESAPAWAEALADRAVDRILSGVLAPGQVQDVLAVIAELERVVRQRDATSGDPNGALDPGESAPPRQATG